MSKAIEVYKALGNETRLSIAKELARRDEEVAGSQILTGCSKALGLAQPTLSQHFARLVSSGVLIERKQGKEKYYQLNKELLASAGINIDVWRAENDEK